MDMATRDDLGLVWMGEMLLQSDPTEFQAMVNPQAVDNSFFTHSPHSMEELRNRAPIEIDGFMMLDELEDPYCSLDMEIEEDDEEEAEGEGGGKLMTSSATQTQLQVGSRKIKPIKHPGLKLQTPIAYQRDTDLSVIPIKKDGMARCEKCGAIGVKHAFYTRERRFCSMACSRGSSESEAILQTDQQQLPYTPFKLWQNMNQLPVAVKMTPPLMPMPPPPPLPADDPPFPPDKQTIPDLAHTYDWSQQLEDEGFVAAPVSCFKHTPMADCWDNITTGMKVEVENTDCDNFSEDFPDSFWVATVHRIAGYKALLRYEGFGNNSTKDFWVNLCSSMVHPVGWCATRGKPLIPPKTIEDRYRDWKDFLVRRLTGARTLPSNFYNKVHDNLKSRFRCDLNLEVVDKNRISQVKVAKVERIVGKRLHVVYYNEPEDNGFWCHEDSSLIHPVGWALRVGHSIDAPESYIDRCNKGLRDKDDATEELFHKPETNAVPGVVFREGMKLEAIDPLNLSTICAATIMKILNEGYLMIKVDSYEEGEGDGSDWFCYHMSSPSIFPAGFCSAHDVPLTPPRGYDSATFHWDQYLNGTDATIAPVGCFNSEHPNHSFVVNMHLESADLMDPRLVCVGRIARIEGRLLKIHFDGWEEEYDQWLDYESPDIYPVGWCHLAAHKLEGPHIAVKNGITTVGAKPVTKHGRKRGRRRMLPKSGSKGPGRAGKSPVNTTIGVRHAPAATTSLLDLGGSHKEEAWDPATQVTVLKSDPTLCYLSDGSVGVGPEEREPEMGQEPDGPDQSLPVACDPATPHALLPAERNATSYINSWSGGKVIPRLVDTYASIDPTEVTPRQWSISEVAEFLRINDSATYCDNFINNKIDGKTLINLTRDQIINLTGKVGPSVKIYELIQKLNPSQAKKIGLHKKLL